MQCGQSSQTAQLACVRSHVHASQSGRMVTGTLPKAWGGIKASRELSVLNMWGQGLTGPLPAEWGSNGSFPALQTLYLGVTTFSGPLPTAWGASHSVQRLALLSIQSLGMAGIVTPEAWTKLPNRCTVACQHDFPCMHSFRFNHAFLPSGKATAAACLQVPCCQVGQVLVPSQTWHSCTYMMCSSKAVFQQQHGHRMTLSHPLLASTSITRFSLVPCQKRGDVPCSSC